MFPAPQALAGWGGEDPSDMPHSGVADTAAQLPVSTHVAKLTVSSGVPLATPSVCRDPPNPLPLLPDTDQQLVAPVSQRPFAGVGAHGSSRGSYTSPVNIAFGLPGSRLG